MKKITKINITIILILSIIISYGSVIISMAAEIEIWYFRTFDILSILFEFQRVISDIIFLLYL